MTLYSCLPVACQDYLAAVYVYSIKKGREHDACDCIVPGFGKWLACRQVNDLLPHVIGSSDRPKIVMEPPVLRCAERFEFSFGG